MTLDSTSLGDNASAAAGYCRDDDNNHSFVRGHGVVELRGPAGELKASIPFTNIITQVGDQRYAEAGALETPSVARPVTMQLGTGTTTPSKTGAGAAIVTVVANSVVAINTPSSALNGTVRRITYVATWEQGVATSNGIAEVALTSQATSTQTAAPASATIARALLAPTVNKGASDSLTVTWSHDIGSQ